MKRILLLRYGDELIIDALERAFERHQCEVKKCIISDSFKFDDLKSLVDSFRPDFVLTHNSYAFDQFPEIDDLFRRLGIPVALWFWDSPKVTCSMQRQQSYLFGPYPNHWIHLVIDPDWLEFFDSRKLRVHYLPLAADERLLEWTPQADSPGKSFFSSQDLSFVGKPFEWISDISHVDFQNFFTETFLDEFLYWIELKKAALGVNDDQLASLYDCLRRPIKIFFEKDYFSSAQFKMSWSSLDSSLRELLSPSVYRVFLLMSGRLEMLYSWAQMNTYLKRLLSHRLSVFGGSDWKNWLEIKCDTRRLSQEELMECFSLSKISLSYTKWQFASGVHERPFLILALGGFPLTDYRKGLDDLFEKDEIAVYHGLEDLVEKVEFFQSHSAIREQISKRGRERVRRNHTYFHRAGQILELFKR